MSASVTSSNKSLNRTDSESLSESDKDSTPNDSAVGERLRGDGQEQDNAASKKIDDDEDRRNPQYIPKRGNFYEHDDRTVEDVDGSDSHDSDGGEKGGVDKETPQFKKKVWEEKDGEKWGHDLYIEKDQLPKTKQDLINAYGYDIRNEDGPPRARRRRRYGRGPNKYTRNWEDEEAYNRSGNVSIRGKKNPKNPPSKEEFPPLNYNPKDDEVVVQETIVSHVDVEPNVSVDDKNMGSGDGPQNRRDYGVESSKRPSNWKKAPRIEKKMNMPLNDQQRMDEKPNMKNIRHSRNANNQFSNKPQSRVPKHRRRGSPGGEEYRKYQQSPKPNRPDEQHPTKMTPISSQSFSNSGRNKINTSDVYEVAQEIDNMKLDVKDEHQKSSSSAFSRQGSVPPRLQNEQQRLGPKRYSSLRQRSLPETTAPSFTPPSHQVNAAYYSQVAEYSTPNQQAEKHPIHQQVQMAGNNQPQPMMLNAMAAAQQIVPNQVQSSQSVHAMQINHSAQQPMLSHLNSHQTNAPPQVGQVPHHQQMIGAQPLIQHSLPQNAAPPTQVSHPSMLNALSQSAAHQPILTQAQSLLNTQALSGQTQAMLTAQSQQMLTSQGHPQFGGAPPQFQVQAPPGPNAVYNIPQAVSGSPGAAYLPQQSPAVINYASAAPGPPPSQYPPTAYPPYQQAYSAPTAQPAQELYQPQGGITYYSPHNQQVVPRPALKRPKAAIPILAPPDRSPNNTLARGRGRSSPPENNVDTKTQADNYGSLRGRGRVSPIEMDATNSSGGSGGGGDGSTGAFQSRGRGRRLSNEMTTLDSNFDQTRPEVMECPPDAQKDCETDTQQVRGADVVEHNKCDEKLEQPSSVENFSINVGIEQQIDPVNSNKEIENVTESTNISND